MRKRSKGPIVALVRPRMNTSAYSASAVSPKTCSALCMYGVKATQEREVNGERNFLDGPHHAISARPVRGVTSAIRGSILPGVLSFSASNRDDLGSTERRRRFRSRRFLSISLARKNRALTAGQVIERDEAISSIDLPWNCLSSTTTLSFSGKDRIASCRSFCSSFSASNASGSGDRSFTANFFRSVIGQLQEELAPLSQLHQRRIDRDSCSPGEKARALVERGQIQKRV